MSMERKTMNIGGLELHYTDSGDDGMPIVLLHGWGCRASTLDSVAAVASRHGRVLALDLPGFGDTPEPPEPWGVEEYTRFVEAFADKLGLTAPVLLGHSFGGRISLLYGSRREVRSLVLVDAAGIKPKRTLRSRIRLMTYKLGCRAIKCVLPTNRADAIITRWRDERSSADYKAASPMMKRILSRVVNEDLKHVMPSIKAPALLIWGARDTATPLSDAKQMEKLIPDAGLVTFPYAGHYSFLDEPGQFAAVLDNYLNHLSR